MKTKLGQILYDREITQRDVAERIGVSPATVSYIVNGHKNPSAATLKKIAKFLGVPMDEIVD